MERNSKIVVELKKEMNDIKFQYRFGLGFIAMLLFTLNPLGFVFLIFGIVIIVLSFIDHYVKDKQIDKGLD